MTFAAWQLIRIVIYVAMAYGAYKVKNKSLKGGIIAIILISFFFSPIRAKQPGVSSIESGPDFSVPERVTVGSDFEEFQQAEMLKLKKESEKVKP